jgi:hypothetical protein
MQYEHYVSLYATELCNVKIKKLSGEIIEIFQTNIYDSRALVYYNKAWRRVHVMGEIDNMFIIGMVLLKTKTNNCQNL